MVKLDNLFMILSQKGISQSRLAEDTSISTGNISDWKRGRSMPSAVKLDELATYLDCSVDYLLGRTDGEAETVKLIYKLYLEGHGSKFIAAELNRMGIAPAKLQYLSYTYKKYPSA